MTVTNEPLPDHLAAAPRLGDEITITGKWVPKTKGGRFRKSEESIEMLQEWEDIHLGARSSRGVLSTEINHAVGEDAVLVHHVFENADALSTYFGTTATDHMAALSAVATPELHLVRGTAIPSPVRRAILAKNVPAVFGEHLYGFVKNDHRRPDPATAIGVTAKWTCTPGEADNLEELRYWWQRVGTDAFSMEEEMLRFEVYQVAGDDALIVHEVFENNEGLKFHLTKGTAERYKKNIDQIASPEAYFFRGPVSWTIRTYSKFMHLPATYSSQGSNYTRAGGSMSDGTIA